jgi:hypothetical protein
MTRIDNDAHSLIHMQMQLVTGKTTLAGSVSKRL